MYVYIGLFLYSAGCIGTLVVCYYWLLRLLNDKNDDGEGVMDTNSLPPADDLAVAVEVLQADLTKREAEIARLRASLRVEADHADELKKLLAIRDEKNASLWEALTRLTAQIKEQRDIVARHTRAGQDYTDGLKDGREDTFNDVLEMIDALHPDPPRESNLPRPRPKPRPRNKESLTSQRLRLTAMEAERREEET